MALRKLWMFSATSVGLRQRCPRLWFGSTMLGIRDGQTEQKDAGISLHKLVEAYIKTGALPPDDADRLTREAFQSAITHLGLTTSFNRDLVRAELSFCYRTPLMPLSYKGAMDVLDLRQRYDGIVIIPDLKTSNNPACYAKTPDVLIKDPASIGYAHAVIHNNFAVFAKAPPIHSLVVRQININRLRPSEVYVHQIVLTPKETEMRFLDVVDQADYMVSDSLTYNENNWLTETKTNPHPTETCNAYKRLCPLAKMCNKYVEPPKGYLK